MKSYLVQVALSITGLLLTTAGASAGNLDFGPEQFVQAGDVDIQVPGYSVPSLADWNGDGLQDLIVGEGGVDQTGVSNPGKVRVYLNVGTAAKPEFRNYFYAQHVYGDIACTPIGCMGCFPRVVDWDEDGLPDLLVGQADGMVRIFTNCGIAGAPFFDTGPNIITADGTVDYMDAGDRATPSVVDWNSNGWLDIVSGGLDGRIHVYMNCGCGGTVPPRFLGSPAEGAIVHENGGDLIVPSGRSSPVFADLDGDGKKDILTGNTDGQILFYKNVGVNTLPMFSGYAPVTSAGTFIDLPGSLRSRPFLCHWSVDKTTDVNNGPWDLLVGYGDGKVRLYRYASASTTTPAKAKAGDLNGDGVIDSNDFTILAKALDQPISHDGSAADLNGDGAVDSLDLRVFANLWLTEHK
jgi:WD40 repeat protein